MPCRPSAPAGSLVSWQCHPRSARTLRITQVAGHLLRTAHAPARPWALGHQAIRPLRLHAVGPSLAAQQLISRRRIDQLLTGPRPPSPCTAPGIACPSGRLFMLVPLLRRRWRSSGQCSLPGPMCTRCAGKTPDPGNPDGCRRSAAAGSKASRPPFQDQSNPGLLSGRATSPTSSAPERFPRPETLTSRPELPVLPHNHSKGYACRG